MRLGCNKQEGIFMEQKQENPREEIKSKQTCELCNFPYPSTLVDDRETFLLCPIHLLSLVELRLTVKEARRLIKKHGDETFYLHDDYYDEKGHALQPVV